MADIELLDLFCGGGGCSAGYQRAAESLGLSINITGVDNKKMPSYPFRFVQDDALEFLQRESKNYSHVHASPPCQLFSKATIRRRIRFPTEHGYVDLCTPVKRMMEDLNCVAVIENVPGAPIRPDLVLNGQMFGLKVIRSRWFETVNWFCMKAVSLAIKNRSVIAGSFITVTSSGIYNVTGRGGIDLIPGSTNLEKQRFAMGIDWMNQREIGQAIPPAYTRWIGEQWFRPLVK